MKVTEAVALPELIHDAAERGAGITVRSSTGPGREGRSEPAENCTQIDLSGIDRIININRDERVAIVEPGVTYQMLADAIEPHGLRVCHPLLPPAGKSVLASLIDREPQTIPKYHWDFTDPLLCAEVYFGTGERFRTGGAAGPGKTLEEQWSGGMFQKNPLGPAQTDLIKLVQASQGTMGIATWASVRLECKPEIRRGFVTAGSFARLAEFVSAITRRRLGDEIMLLDAAQAECLSSALNITAPALSGGEWLLAIVIGSLPFHPEESIAFQVTEATELAAAVGVELNGDETGFVRAITAAATAAGDWKRASLGEDFSQIYFLSTLNRAEQLVDVARKAWGASEPDSDICVASYVQPLNQGRTCHVEVTIQGRVSLDDGARKLAEAGAFFSRPSAATTPVAYERCPDTVRALRKVKDVLDPPHVLNPGRLFDDPRVEV
ncbi:MAG: hypothetical protein DCC49_11760 [Acidobacteria bacterium]|nr:MAG: hypothetical protein DCC49_11760 [Acidobacteriota bacterium]